MLERLALEKRCTIHFSQGLRGNDPRLATNLFPINLIDDGGNAANVVPLGSARLKPNVNGFYSKPFATNLGDRRGDWAASASRWGRKIEELTLRGFRIDFGGLKETGLIRHYQNDWQQKQAGCEARFCHGIHRFFFQNREFCVLQA